MRFLSGLIVGITFSVTIQAAAAFSPKGTTAKERVKAYLEVVTVLHDQADKLPAGCADQACFVILNSSYTDAYVAPQVLK